MTPIIWTESWTSNIWTRTFRIHYLILKQQLTYIWDLIWDFINVSLFGIHLDGFRSCHCFRKAWKFMQCFSRGNREIFCRIYCCAIYFEHFWWCTLYDKNIIILNEVIIRLQTNVVPLKFFSQTERYRLLGDIAFIKNHLTLNHELFSCILDMKSMKIELETVSGAKQRGSDLRVSSDLCSWG